MVHMYEEKTTVVTDQGFDGRSPTIRLHANDDVVIARHQVEPGTRLPEEGDLLVTRLIPPGHKVATRAICTGEAVHRYNQVIGVATQDIAPGDHVHTHNVGMAGSSATTRSVPTPARRSMRPILQRLGIVTRRQRGDA
jgi:hypothetical protein